MSAGPETAPPAPEPGDGRRARRAEERRKTRQGRRVSVAAILGELLITAGVLALLFLGWQLWFTELTVGHEQRAEASAQSQQWNEQATSSPTPSATPTDSADPSPVVTDPPVGIAPANA